MPITMWTPVTICFTTLKNILLDQYCPSLQHGVEWHQPIGQTVNIRRTINPHQKGCSEHLQLFKEPGIKDRN